MATKICGCKEMAKDLTQEMYLKVYNKKIYKNIEAYIYRVLKNIYLNQERKLFLDKANRKDKVFFIPLILNSGGCILDTEKQKT